MLTAPLNHLNLSQLFRFPPCSISNVPIFQIPKLKFARNWP